jgi:hypothetical protein
MGMTGVEAGLAGVMKTLSYMSLRISALSILVTLGA